MRSFPALYFDVTKVSGVTDRTPEARLSLSTGHGRNAGGLQSPLLPLVCFLSLWIEILMAFCSVLSNKFKVSPREKMCGLLGLLPLIYNS